MKKLSLLLVFCLLLTAMGGCGSAEPTEVTAEPTQTTQATEATESTEATEATEETQPPYPTIIGYELDILEEFEASVSENDQLLYLSPNAPKDPSYILIQIYDRDETVLTLDKDGFKALEPIERNFTSISLETTTLDGIGALFADYTVKEDGVYTHIYEYHVAADRNYMFRFADSTNNNDWLDSYAQCIETIDLLTQEENLELDYSHLEQYRLKCGVSLYAFDRMEQQDAPGFTECIGNREALILVMQDKKADNNLEGFTLEQYAELVETSNDLDAFTLDNYGNLHTSFYSNDDLGVRYYNVLTVKESADSFWVFQMTCAAADQATYDREFALWATSITID